MTRYELTYKLDAPPARQRQALDIACIKLLGVSAHMICDIWGIDHHFGLYGWVTMVLDAVIFECEGPCPI